MADGASDAILPIPVERQLARAHAAAMRRGRQRWPTDLSVTLDEVRRLWIVQGGRCAVSGLLFDDERFEDALVKHPYRASLDRINPRRGYVAGNVRLVCTAANFGMGQWGEAVLRRIAGGMLAPRGSKEEEAVWLADKRARLAALNEEAKRLEGAELAIQRRKIAALKRVISLGPAGLANAAGKAAKARGLRLTNAARAMDGPHATPPRATGR